VREETEDWWGEERRKRGRRAEVGSSGGVRRNRGESQEEGRVERYGCGESEKGLDGRQGEGGLMWNEKRG